MNEYLKQFDDCLQHEVSFCSAACPFNLDVNAFIARLQEGRFNAAYKTYRDATGFPFIAQKLCTEPCKEACLRNAVVSEDKTADPIELLKLEKTCLAYVKRKDPTSYNVPGKNKRIAIIGAGISGMACALRMATKKYHVTIYEKSDHLGGMLNEIMDPQIFNADFDLQMQHLNYTIKYNTEIKSLDELLELGRLEVKLANDAYASNSDSSVSKARSVMRSASIHANKAISETYDAIYVATGKGGESFGVPLSGEPCRMLGETAVFLGGSLTGADPVHALADGLRMSTAIDNYTLTKLLKYPVYPTTDIAIDETVMITTTRIACNVTDNETYTQDEAVAEANRCMKCQCSACRLHCDLTEYLHKWPLRLKDEVIATTAPGKSELHATPAVRTINTCTHCGLCRETCPENIDMDGLFQAARIRMHKLNKMPWAFNDFFLRDMDFTNGAAAYLCRKLPLKQATDTGKTDIDLPNESASYAFFPGCQLGASSPELVVKSYEYLLKLDPGAGIMLGCCGIPAQWAGNEELLDSVIERIRNEWRSLAKPTMVLACPTCRKTFKKYLPEIKTVYLYEIMAEHGLQLDEHCIDSAALCLMTGKVSDSSVCIASVFDPCATSNGDPVRDAVRKLCGDLNLTLEALPVQEKWTACCSFGGHGMLADPSFTKYVRDKRIDLSSNPYITYCINCRDAFLHEGKRAAHILNLIFGIEPRLETVTKRRENRIWLKDELMKRFWGESPIDDVKASSIKEAGGEVGRGSEALTLRMSDEVRRKLSAEFILESEAADVVSFCERTGRTLYDEEKQSYTGYRKIGNLTYWVEYQKPEPALNSSDYYALLNAYTHRMEIELEMVWNGEKIKIDM